MPTAEVIQFLEQPKVVQLLLSEYGYWRDTPRPGANGDRDVDLVAMGAMGAIANVLGSVLGHPAPWHPGGKLDLPPAEQRSST